MAQERDGNELASTAGGKPSSRLDSPPSVPKGPPTVKPTRALGTEGAAREHHVRAILRLMRSNQWERGVTGPEYALEHGLNSVTVRSYAAEAWRTLGREVTDVGKMTEDIAANLYGRLRNAGDREAPKIADVLSRVIGARAPERHTIALEEVRQYEGMTNEAKLAWLDTTIASMQAERERVALLIADTKALPEVSDG